KFSSEDKEQVDYQTLLLKELSNLIKQDSNVKLQETSKIEDLESIIKEIKEYIKLEQELATRKNEYDDNIKKSELLEEQISKLTEKDSIGSSNSQLLYAFYKLKNKQNKLLIDEYVKNQNNFRKSLLDSLKTIKIPNNETLQSKITKIENSYEQILKEEKRLSLALDKAKISENESKINSLNNEIITLENEKSK